MAVRVDLSGWKITDGIEYTFPENSVMEPGAYWTITSNPEHSSFIDITNLHGPFAGKLSNSGELLTLLGRHGRIMDEFEYSDRGAWPSAPDGGGVTLAKWNSNAASGRPSNWTWSTLTNGTPSKNNFENRATDREHRFNAYQFVQANRGFPRGLLRLSEIAGTNDSSFFIEIENIDSHPLSTGGFSINGLALPDKTLAAGAFRTYTTNELEVALETGDVLFLKQVNGRVLDAVRIQENSRAFDNEREIWQYSSTPTPNAFNSFEYHSEIVINEINYHNRPVYADPKNSITFSKSNVEWIELYNRSQKVIDFSGWMISDAIEYEFPNGTTIAPDEFIIIIQSHFSKSLGNHNDRIQLLDANKNIADLVEYFDDAPWPKNADGRGSSLELRHPDADNSNPSSWIASDESAKSTWQSFTYRGLGVEPRGTNNPNYFHEFLMGMLDRGEVLIDDISVIEDPDNEAVELMQNGDFESDPTGASPMFWRILGNHRNSHVVKLPEGGKALRLIATGALEHSYNIASTTFANGREIDTTKTYEISFRAKWVSGSPQLNTRLYFNRLPRTHILPQPFITGTPGAANSTLLTAAPPSISNFSHSPIVPDENQTVQINATLTAPSGISTATLYYSLNNNWKELAMSSDSESEYTAIIPAQANGSIVQFYVKATTNTGATAFYPPQGSDSRALFRVGNRVDSNSKIQILRLIVLPKEADFMHTAHHVPSEQRFGATIIYNDTEVWYDAGIRLRGSPSGRRSSRVGWNIKFPADHPFRGVHETIAIDGGFSIPRGDGTGWIEIGAGIATNELIYNQMANRSGGIPSSYDDIAYIEAPRAREDKQAQLKMARFKDIWKASSFEDGDDGTSFEFELIYHPNTTIDGNPESLKATYDQLLSIQIKDLGTDQEAYRHNFLIQNHRDEDNYSPVIAASIAISNSENLRSATTSALDIDNWLRVMAFQALTTTIDSYNNNGYPHNMLLFGRPSDSKTMWIPWDVDNAFYLAPTSSIFGKGNTDFADVIEIPANRRAYGGHLLDLCNTGFNPSYISNWISHFNEVSNQPLAEHYQKWITNRRKFVLSELNIEFPIHDFKITSNNGINFSHNHSQIELRGRGWINVKEIISNETNEKINLYWENENQWKTTVGLSIGENIITLSALDNSGNEVGSDSITITNTSSVEAANSHNLIISEIMYHPSDPTTQESELGYDNEKLFEYIEIQNIGINTIELNNVQFDKGINFNFSNASISQIHRGKTVLLVKNQLAFEQRYGTGLPIAGYFQNDTGLSNAGEQLRIVDTSNKTIQSFSYNDKSPWPELADGDGHSLILVKPFTNPNPNFAANWKASKHVNGTPSVTETTLFSGDRHNDSDNDGISDFMNYALGGNGPFFTPNIFIENKNIIFFHQRNLSASDIQFQIEFSNDLKRWSPANAVLESETSLGTGNSLLKWKIINSAEYNFIRLRVRKL